MAMPAGAGPMLATGSRYSAHTPTNDATSKRRVGPLPPHSMTTSTCRLRSAQSRRATSVTHCCCGRVRVASRHWGRASEAGAQRLYVKFGAVRPGAGADERFDALLNAGSALAREVGMTTVVAGVNLARENAPHQMCNRGFRGGEVQIVTMHRPNEPRYSRPNLYAPDDWR